MTWLVPAAPKNETSDPDNRSGRAREKSAGGRAASLRIRNRCRGTAFPASRRGRVLESIVHPEAQDAGFKARIADQHVALIGQVDEQVFRLGGPIGGEAHL